MPNSGYVTRNQLYAEIAACEGRVKAWIVRAVLTQVAALLVPAFFLGGIYVDGKSVMAKTEINRRELNRRLLWIRDRENWEAALEVWAEGKGFKAPPRREYQSDHD
jgi:hypothetical protein